MFKIIKIGRNKMKEEIWDGEMDYGWEDLAEKVISLEMSVRETEKTVSNLLNPKMPRKKVNSDSAYSLSIKKVEQELSARMGTKVTLKDKHNKGTISIEYYSAEELERLLEVLKN